VQWPSTEEVKPETLPALPRNIAKNFMATFFQERGRELVAHEGSGRSTICLLLPSTLPTWCSHPFYLVAREGNRVGRQSVESQAKVPARK